MLSNKPSQELSTAMPSSKLSVARASHSHVFQDNPITETPLLLIRDDDDDLDDDDDEPKPLMSPTSPTSSTTATMAPSMIATFTPAFTWVRSTPAQLTSPEATTYTSSFITIQTILVSSPRPVTFATTKTSLLTITTAIQTLTTLRAAATSAVVTTSMADETTSIGASTQEPWHISGLAIGVIALGIFGAIAIVLLLTICVRRRLGRVRKSPEVQTYGRRYRLGKGGIIIERVTDVHFPPTIFTSSIPPHQDNPKNSPHPQEMSGSIFSRDLLNTQIDQPYSSTADSIPPDPESPKPGRPDPQNLESPKPNPHRLSRPFSATWPATRDSMASSITSFTPIAAWVSDRINRTEDESEKKAMPGERDAASSDYGVDWKGLD